MLPIREVPFLNLRSAQISFILLIALASPCLAVHWTGSQTAPGTWNYTLQIDPEDNFNVSQATTTITMTGLSGVTAAGPPTSSDFPNPIGTAILAWTPQVLNGGTTVVWSIAGGGTGNFSTVQHVFGFTITAPGAANGTVSFATNGFQVDDNGPRLDISGTVAGPASASPESAPAASSITLLAIFAGLTLTGAYQLRARLRDRVGD